MSKKIAVVLLSGGMDSTTLATLAKSKFDEVVPLNVYYGQRHDVEIASAHAVARHLGLSKIEERNIEGCFVGSSLLKGGPEVDDNQDKASVGATYVPARNSVLLSIAAGFADAIGATHVYYGAHAEDHAGYPDCRPEYFEAVRLALELGTRNGVTITAPFIDKTKSDIVSLAAKLGAPLHLTHSCYRGVQPACGTCPTCQLRIDSFKAAGYIDPVPYAVDIDWGDCQPFPGSPLKPAGKQK